MRCCASSCILSQLAARTHHHRLRFTTNARTTFLPFVILYPFIQLPGCSAVFPPTFSGRESRSASVPPAACPVGSAAVDGGTCHALPRPSHAEPGREMEIPSTHNSRIRKLVFVRHRLGGPVGLSSPRLAFAGWGRPLRRRIVTAGARALGHPAHPRACRVPRTHPCSHAMLLHASIAPSHSSTAATAQAKLWPAVPVRWPLRSCWSYHTSHSRTSRAPCPQGVNNLCAFLYSSSSSCVFPVYRPAPTFTPMFYLSANDATRVRPRLTFTSPASVLLHT